MANGLNRGREYEEKKEALIKSETESINLPVPKLVEAIVSESLTNSIPPNQEQSEERTIVRTLSKFSVLLGALSRNADEQFEKNMRMQKQLLILTWVIVILTILLLGFEAFKTLLRSQ